MKILLDSGHFWIQNLDSENEGLWNKNSNDVLQSIVLLRSEYLGVTMHQFSFKIPAPFDENYVRKQRRARSATSHDESDAGILGLTFDANLLRFLTRFICAFILGFYIMYV